MPHTIPPMSWLRAVRAFRIRPGAKTPSIRDTRTLPRSGSTRTSANCAPNDSVVYFCRSSKGPVLFESSMALDPERRTTSAYESAPPRPWSRPFSTRTSSGRKPRSGEAASAIAILTIFSRSAVQVSSTAEPTLAAVIDPAAIGASGISLSPKSKRVFSYGTPSASAAICAITVYVPVPRSIVPLSTCAVPSGKRRATALAGEQFAG